MGLEVVTKHVCIGKFTSVFGTLDWYGLIGFMESELVELIFVFSQDIHALVKIGHHLNRVLRGGRQLGLRMRICFLLSAFLAATSL